MSNDIIYFMAKQKDKEAPTMIDIKEIEQITFNKVKKQTLKPTLQEIYKELNIRRL